MSEILPMALAYLVGALTGGYLTWALHPLWHRCRCLCDFCLSIRDAGKRTR